MISWGTLAVLSEISDKFDGGVYDPKDFLAYATGLGLGYIIDKKLESKIPPRNST